MGGDNCTQCPNLPEYPAKCIEDEPILWREDIEEGKDCPVLLMGQFDNYFMGWRFLERNALPRHGGWQEQACHWIQAFEIIGGELARWQREQIKKRNRKD